MDDDPVVIEQGSSVCRAGFAGGDSPKVAYTKIARNKPGKLYMSDISHTSSDIEYPITRGLVTNWESMEKVWRHCFEELKIMPDQRAVLLTEAAMNPRANREKIAQSMFETFRVPALFVGVQSMINFYSQGHLYGLLVDCGEGITEVLGAHNGYLYLDAISRLDLAGADVTEYLRTLLSARGYSLTFEQAQEIKENLVYVALDYEQEMKKGETTSYQLPDGQIVDVGCERFQCAEALFRPSLLALQNLGIHELACNTILKCPLDARWDFYDRIILSGGTSLIPGFEARMHKELCALVSIKKKIRFQASPERLYSTWIGASVCASLSNFPQCVVSKEEYEEMGPGVMFRKGY